MRVPATLPALPVFAAPVACGAEGPLSFFACEPLGSYGDHFRFAGAQTMSFRGGWLDPPLSGDAQHVHPIREAVLLRRG